MPSQAYNDFLDALRLPDALMNLESLYPDPPTPQDQHIVEGLRGGATVLMVAAFENYLKELVEEHLSEMTTEPLRFQVQNVPNKTRRINIEQRLEYIRKRKKADDRVAEYLNAAQLISSGVMMTDSFTVVARSNPNSERVKELYNSLGVADFFSTAKADFDQEWGSATANTFVQDKLDEIVSSRHSVAHSANVLNISRLALQEWLHFLAVLGAICDQVLFSQVRTFF